MKRCSVCKQEKDESEFHKNRSRKDGLAYACKECRSVRTKKYRKEHKPWIKRYADIKDDPTFKEKKRMYKKVYQEKARQEAYDHYGRACVICGYNDERALTLDHVNNDGAEHRKGGVRLPAIWARMNGYPDTLQILCRNCNWIKHIENT